MADLTTDKNSTPIRIVGNDEEYACDVVLVDGVRKLQTSTTVTVESLNGFDDLPDNWIYVNAVSTDGTLRVEIDATDGSPALDKTFTVLVGETRYTFVQRIVNELNSDFVNFQPYFRAQKIKDNAILYITSKFFGEFGENKNTNSFRVSVTGGVNAYVAYDKFERKGKVVGLSRSEDDPRFGILGISGEVASRSGDIGGLYINQPKYLGSESLLVDGSVTPKEFTFAMDTLKDIYVREIRIFGKGNGIKFGQFLSKNTVLTNGLLVEIKTDNQLVEFLPIKRTEGFKDKFAFGSGDNFQLYVQAGGDTFLAVFISESPFPLRKAGTFGMGNDDYLKIVIRDDISSGITSLESLVFGFSREA